MNYKKISVLGAILIIYLILGINVAKADIISSTQGGLQVNENQTFDIIFSIDNTNDVFSLSFDLIYDPNLLQFNSIQEGAFISQGCSVFNLYSDNGAGRVIAGISRIGSCGGISGEGEVMKVSMTSLGSVGIAQVAFENNSICIYNGTGCDNVSGTWNNVNIQIGEPVDLVSPLITLNGNSVVELFLGESYVDSGAQAIDDVDGDISANIITTGSVNTDVVGQYILRYNASDGAGNHATEVIRTIIVSEPLDVMNPVITLVGPSLINHEVNTIYVDQGAQALDNIDGDISSNIITSNNLDISVLGSYIYRYNVADSAGNNALEITRSVNILDTTSPTLVLNGSASLQIHQGTNYIDLGATAFDNYDGNITNDIQVAGNVDTGTVADYKVFYNVADSSGNRAYELVRTVSVVSVPDTSAPIITLIGQKTINQEINTSYNDLGALANDDVDGDITSKIVVENSVNIAQLGTYFVRYNVMDSVGNKAMEVIRTVNIIDTSPPIISPVDYNSYENSINILWGTNEPTRNLIEYGESSFFTHSLNINTTYQTSFNSRLTSLLSNTLYYFRITSTDKSGNKTQSQIYSIKTQTNILPPINQLDDSYWIDSYGTIDRANNIIRFNNLSVPNNSWDRLWGKTINTQKNKIYEVSFDARVQNYSGSSARVSSRVQLGQSPWTPISNIENLDITSTNQRFTIELYSVQSVNNASIVFWMGHERGNFTISNILVIEKNPGSIIPSNPIDSTFWVGSQGDISYAFGTMDFNINQGYSNPWEVLWGKSVSAQKDKIYEISFDAEVQNLEGMLQTPITVRVQYGYSPWSPTSEIKKVSLLNGTKRYIIDMYNVQTVSNASIVFWMGYSRANINISNISYRVVTPSQTIPSYPLDDSYWAGNHGVVDHAFGNINFNVNTNLINPWDAMWGKSLFARSDKIYRISFNADSNNLSGKANTQVSARIQLGHSPWSIISETKNINLSNGNHRYTVDLYNVQSEPNASLVVWVGHERSDIKFYNVILEEKIPTQIIDSNPLDSSYWVGDNGSIDYAFGNIEFDINSNSSNPWNYLWGKNMAVISGQTYIISYDVEVNSGQGYNMITSARIQQGYSPWGNVSNERVYNNGNGTRRVSYELDITQSDLHAVFTLWAGYTSGRIKFSNISIRRK